jgi:hypothetical protein
MDAFVAASPARAFDRMTASPPAGGPLGVRFWGAAARGSWVDTPASRAATRIARCFLRNTHLFLLGFYPIRC